MTGRVLMLLALAAVACGGDAAEAPQSQTPTTGTPATTQASPPPAPETTATSEPSGTVASGDGCAHVIGATVEVDGTTAVVSATVLSDDTGWDKYADAWEVRTADGVVLGERVLTHPHETEQPFTRSLAGVEIPLEVAAVVIAAHDSVFGWCGETFTVELPPRS